MTTELEARCAEAKQLVIDLMGEGILVTHQPDHAPILLEKIRELRVIAAKGTAGIEDQSYITWQSHAVTTLDAMEKAVQEADYFTSWDLFKHPERGMYLLGQACQGCPGW